MPGPRSSNADACCSPRGAVRISVPRLSGRRVPPLGPARMVRPGSVLAPRAATRGPHGIDDARFQSFRACGHAPHVGERWSFRAAGRFAGCSRAVSSPRAAVAPGPATGVPVSSSLLRVSGPRDPRRSDTGRARAAVCAPIRLPRCRAVEAECAIDRAAIAGRRGGGGSGSPPPGCASGRVRRRGTRRGRRNGARAW